MTEELVKAGSAAVLVAFEQLEFSRQEKILILSGALEALTVQEEVEQTALEQLVNGDS